MLWVFSVAGLAGIFCGHFLRVSAIVFLSFLAFGSILASAAFGAYSFGAALIAAFATVAALQAGYVLGLGLEQVRRRMASRLAGYILGLEVETLWSAPSKTRFRGAGQRAKIRNLAG